MDDATSAMGSTLCKEALLVAHHLQAYYPEVLDAARQHLAFERARATLRCELQRHVQQEVNMFFETVKPEEVCVLAQWLGMRI